MPTWDCPHPLANPLNRHRFQEPRRQTVSKPTDPSKLEVPNQDVPLFGSDEWYARNQAQSGLTVPNQDVPPGDQLRGAGFFPGSDRLFKLSDGTVMDFKTGRILRTPKSVPGYWGDPDAKVPCPYQVHDSAMRREPTMDELITNIDYWKGTARPDSALEEPMDPASAAYWLRAQEEAEKLKASMTDEQKAAIAAFEAHFPRSKLIEESQKPGKNGTV